MSDSTTSTAKSKKAASNWYYDLSAKQASSDLIDEGRFFQWDAPGDNPNACPERNGIQVNAIPVPDKGAYPASVLEIAARLAQ